ncbi:hypothetical protein PR048_016240 [Dryococelus australis]|uniref:Ig-like domain-containing protein n=1 Tax=Dryococelus australis TaxID=614101 RepID=A0ABQ9HJ64_9NEOP|nr:hypothetical protein PR048_016240 [Dryococelus australis]
MEGDRDTANIVCKRKMGTKQKGTLIWRAEALMSEWEISARSNQCGATRGSFGCALSLLAEVHHRGSQQSRTALHALSIRPAVSQHTGDTAKRGEYGSAQEHTRTYFLNGCASLWEQALCLIGYCMLRGVPSLAGLPAARVLADWFETQPMECRYYQLEIQVKSNPRRLLLIVFEENQFNVGTRILVVRSQRDRCTTVTVASGLRLDSDELGNFRLDSGGARKPSTRVCRTYPKLISPPPVVDGGATFRGTANCFSWALVVSDPPAAHARRSTNFGKTRLPIKLLPSISSGHRKCVGVVVTALVSHHGDIWVRSLAGSLPNVGNVLDDAACRRVFSGCSRTSPPPLFTLQRRSLGSHFMSCPGVENPSLGGSRLTLGSLTTRNVFNQSLVSRQLPSSLPWHELYGCYVGASDLLSCGPTQVSWIRRRDAHILTVDRYTFIADERFQAFLVEATDTWTLQIKYVQARDAGQYECQVSTEPKMSHFITLNVVGEYTTYSIDCVTGGSIRVVLTASLWLPSSDGLAFAGNKKNNCGGIFGFVVSDRKKLSYKLQFNRRCRSRWMIVNVQEDDLRCEWLSPPRLINARSCPCRRNVLYTPFTGTLQNALSTSPGHPQPERTARTVLLEYPIVVRKLKSMNGHKLSARRVL